MTIDELIESYDSIDLEFQKRFSDTKKESVNSTYNILDLKTIERMRRLTENLKSLC